MKRILLITLATFISITFIGCNYKNNKNSSTDISGIATQEKLGEDTDKAVELMKCFEEALPNAQIVSKAMADMDNDKEDDLIIIFNNPIESTKITRSNICVVTNQGINALDLAGSTYKYQFAKDSESLKILHNPTRASVMLQEIETNEIVDFQVTMTTDKKEKLTNFKIESIKQ